MMLQSYVPAEAELRDIAIQSAASHLYLIDLGDRSVLSPVIPAGARVLMNPDSKKLQDFVAKVAA